MDESAGQAITRREMLSRMGKVALGAALTPLASGLGLAAPREGTRPPNIVFLVADDLGYGDVGCYGSTICDTPFLDILASQGVRLSQYYVACPVCAPTRVSFLTGKYPQRTSLAWNPNFKDPEDGLSPDETTIADVLSSAGYHTGLVGKWHMGYAPKFWPRKQGFQEYYGFLSGWMDYYEHTYNEDTKWMYRNEDPIEEEGYATDLFTREALSYIDRHKDEPFFLYVAYSTPHWPAQAPDRWVRRSRHGVYGGMVANMDDSIGQIVQRIDSLGLGRDTLIVFMSDNGDDGHGSNAPLSGGKANLQEGGIRTPFIARWPGRIPAGSVVDTPVISMDLFSTFAAVAGAHVPKSLGVDGRNAMPVLKGESGSKHNIFFWQFDKQVAARKGDMKIIRNEGEPARLYNVVSDPAENMNIADQHPALVKEMTTAIDEWMAGLKPAY